MLPAQIVQGSSTTTGLYLQWRSIEADTFTLYYWKTSTPSDVSTVTTTSLPYNITGLDSNTEYKVIVSAMTNVGSANSSEVVGYTIPEGIYMYDMYDFTSLAQYMYIYAYMY